MSSFSEYYFRNIAMQIRYYRLKNGWTQEWLSEMIGKNHKYIGHIERCERSISKRAEIQLMEIFKVQPRVFYDFKEEFDWKKNT